MRVMLKLLTRRPNLACDNVTALWRLTAQRPFMPSSTSRITSEGTPRMVDVTGATVTVARWPIALVRVRTTTGRCLSGGGNRHSRTSPLLRDAATMRHPPKDGIPPRAGVGPGNPCDPDSRVPTRVSISNDAQAPAESRPTGSPFAASPPDRPLAAAFCRELLVLSPLWDFFHSILHIRICTLAAALATAPRRGYPAPRQQAREHFSWPGTALPSRPISAPPGLAKSVESSATDTLTAAPTRPGTAVGTAPYRSPEQASGKTAECAQRCVFVGVVLYELVAGLSDDPLFVCACA